MAEGGVEKLSDQLSLLKDVDVTELRREGKGVLSKVLDDLSKVW